ncbi:unnamed protein product [Zymoseptoria tritici ST99CH_1A5]|uniref:Uncharacterized protein n=1 Tax=Zymoseptoria tritici ST99CH_1A5 TaxID=1276529 RepID=A0A1Y6M158_ZYMTR|nr:unnamed protein product [Zymoseptoria tritici ST99CH_1A5]
MTPLISTSWTSTFYPSDVSVYTLCDGSPRADIRPWTTSSTYNVTGTPYSYSSLSTPTYTVAQPCITSEQDCHIWYADSSIPDVNERALENQCGNPAHGPDGDCVFGVEGGVQLIYFPVSTVGGDLCTGNGTTIYPTPTSDGPNVITTLGRTFTSGSAYILIKSLSAWIDGFGYTVGPNFSDLILTVKSEDVSTQCKGNKIGTSMNWADLNWPVPASAYECQDRCGRLQSGTSATPAECSTIWSDVIPLLAIPTAVKDLSPLWSTCKFDVPLLANYWFDPPIALQEHSVADSITRPELSYPTTASAAPQSSPTKSRASATALADQVPSSTPRPSSRSASTDLSTEGPPAAESTTT